MIRNRAQAQNQEIELERVVMVIEAMGNNDTPLFDVDPLDLSRKEVDTLKHLADRIHNRRQIQVTGCDLVKHGREQEKIVAIDEGDLDGRILSEFLFQLHGDSKARKPPAQNKYSLPWCISHELSFP